MKLYDYDRVWGLTSFDGGMAELSCEGVTKSFKKAKKEALAEILVAIKELEAELKEVESMKEEDVGHRGCY